MGRRERSSCSSSSSSSEERRCKEKIHFCVVLTGSQEVPPVQTTGLGSGTATLSANRKKLCFKIKFHGLTSPLVELLPPSFAHFHLGAAGENGPVVKDISEFFKLSPDRQSGCAKGVWSKWDQTQPLTKDLVEALKLGHIYVNLHTVAWPSGELRGQLVSL